MDTDTSDLAFACLIGSLWCHFLPYSLCLSSIGFSQFLEYSIFFFIAQPFACVYLSIWNTFPVHFD